MNLLTLEEFHQRYDGSKPAYEYWCGAAIRKSTTTALHGIVQSFLTMFLNHAGWAAGLEIRLKGNRDVEPVPDVVALKGKFKGYYPTVSPAFASRSSHPATLFRKLLKRPLNTSPGEPAAFGSSIPKNAPPGRCRRTT